MATSGWTNLRETTSYFSVLPWAGPLKEEVMPFNESLTPSEELPSDVRKRAVFSEMTRVGRMAVSSDEACGVAVTVKRGLRRELANMS